DHKEDHDDLEPGGVVDIDSCRGCAVCAFDKGAYGQGSGKDQKKYGHKPGGEKRLLEKIDHGCQVCIRHAKISPFIFKWSKLQENKELELMANDGASAVNL